MLDFLRLKQPVSDPDKAVEQPLDGPALFRLMRHFPIGAKVQYYPEYRKEILLDSVVIAYVINDQLIYSALNLQCDPSSGVIEFDDQNEHKVFKKITSFRMVLPVFTQSENKLDYVRREELNKIGGLVKNNVITLIAEQQDGKMPVLETVVEKRTVLKQGYYVDQTVALLEVDFESLMLTDQRAVMRLKTNLPATMQIVKRGVQELVNCHMADFSDRAMRLVIAPDFEEVQLPKPGTPMMVSFNLPGHSEHISLMTEVFRAYDRTVVATITGMIHKGQVTALGQVEILKIKANLLQHSGANLSR